MIFNKDKDEKKFLQRLTKLSPEEFIGLAKLLNIKMSVIDAESGEYAIREAEDIINDMVGSFKHLKHKERKAVLGLMKK
jgi:hypothetical protein